MKLRYKHRRNQPGAFLGAITPWDQSVRDQFNQRIQSGTVAFCDHLTPAATNPDDTVPGVWFPAQPAMLHCRDCAEAIMTALERRDPHRCDICHRDIAKTKTSTKYWLQFGGPTTICYWVCHDCK